MGYWIREDSSASGTECSCPVVGKEGNKSPSLSCLLMRLSGERQDANKWSKCCRGYCSLSSGGRRKRRNHDERAASLGAPAERQCGRGCRIKESLKLTYMVPAVRTLLHDVELWENENIERSLAELCSQANSKRAFLRGSEPPSPSVSCDSPPPTHTHTTSAALRSKMMKGRAKVSLSRKRTEGHTHPS